jgi:hypothetical protein
MILVGCSPAGRNIEQHDIFFGIGNSMRDLVPDIVAFWPETKGKLHFDAWREVNKVDGFQVKVLEKANVSSDTQLFFINLGGYKEGEFEEFHYKMIVAANEKGDAIKQSKQTAFYKHTGFKGAESHIDDKYGIDVDDIYSIQDILPATAKERYSLIIESAPASLPEDEIHLGYFRIDNIEKWAPL